jgi:hypothetical protein
VLVTLTLLTVLWAGPARAQKIDSPADLLPANTVAYGELRHPGQLLKEIHSLFEGSALGNLPESLFQFAAKMGAPADQFRNPTWVEAMGLAMGPELIRELQRMKGAAFAFTGFNRRSGEPEGVAVILPGESNLPGLMMRLFLTVGHTRVVGREEGVTLYRAASDMAPRHAPGVGAPPAPPGGGGPPEHGPVFAMMPGAIVIGSSAEAVTDVIRRAKGKGGAESLARNETFREVVKQAGERAEFFAYLDVGGVMEVVQKHAPLGRGQREVFALITGLVNPKAFKAAGYTLTLDNGTLRYQKVAYLNPNERSPLLEVFPSAAVKTDLLNFAPRNGVFALALSNDNGARRWARLLEIGDKLAKEVAPGGGRGPSEEVKQLEQSLGLNLGKDVFGKIDTVGFAVGDLWTMPLKREETKGENFHAVSVYPEVPVVVLVQATSEEAAKSLAEDVFPKFFALAAREQGLKPSTKEVEGQQVQTLASKRGGTVHYGRQGSTLVFGPYADPVARALRDGPKRQGLLSDAKVAARVKEVEGPIILAVLRPSTLVIAGLGSVGHGEMRLAPADKAPPIPDKQPLRKKEAPEEAAARPARRAAPAAEARAEPFQDPEFERIKKELAKALAHEEPMLFTLTRKPDRWVAEITWTGLKPMVAELTDFTLEQLFKSRRVERGVRPPVIIKPKEP